MAGIGGERARQLFGLAIAATECIAIPLLCGVIPMVHNYTGRNCIGHNYIGRNYIGHDYIGHNYIGMCMAAFLSW